MIMRQKKEAKREREREREKRRTVRKEKKTSKNAKINESQMYMKKEQLFISSTRIELRKLF